MVTRVNRPSPRKSVRGPSHTGEYTHTSGSQATRYQTNILTSISSRETDSTPRGGRPRPPRLTRVEARARNREALLDASAEVFARRGFRVATIDEVAQAAGLTKGAVYSHFENKHDLFASAIERRYEERLEAFRSLLEHEGGPEERAAAAAREFASSVTADADWALLFLEAWAEMLREPSFASRLRGISAEMTRAVEQVIRTQLPAELVGGRGLSPNRLAKMVLAMAHGFGIEHRLDPRRVPKPLFPEMMAIFAAGVAATSAHAADG